VEHEPTQAVSRESRQPATVDGVGGYRFEASLSLHAGIW
jgi:hypothetical protein